MAPHQYVVLVIARTYAGGLLLAQSQAHPQMISNSRLGSHRRVSLSEVAQRHAGVLRLAQVADDAKALRERIWADRLQRGEVEQAAPGAPIAAPAADEGLEPRAKAHTGMHLFARAQRGCVRPGRLQRGEVEQAVPGMPIAASEHTGRVGGWGAKTLPLHQVMPLS